MVFLQTLVSSACAVTGVAGVSYAAVLSGCLSELLQLLQHMLHLFVVA
jgi:hypothetical protein